MRMKKTVIWLDNYLEEFFMVISLILMTVIMGIQVFSRYVLGSAAVLVGGDYPLPVCMVGIFERQLLHKKMYFH